MNVEQVRHALTLLARELRLAVDVPSVLGATMRTLGEVVPFADGVIWQTEGDHLEVVTTTGRASATEAEPLALEVARTGDTVVAGRVLAAPLVALGRVCGVLVLTSDGPTSFGTAEQAVVEAVALQVAAAMETTRRFQEVMELERLKRDFIARVSHELRTPITIINGFLSTLMEHEDRLDASQRHHMIGRSLAASGRLSHLIEDLLVLSRLEAGVLSPEPTTVDVGQVLEAVRDQTPHPEGVVIAPAPRLTVTSDAAMLQRALGFLVDNAVKYGGTATIAASRSNDGWVVIDVRDRGDGIPADVRPHVFEMFTRSARHTDVPGLGVGLPVARTLLEVLHGELAVVEPADGIGTILRVRLPR